MLQRGYSSVLFGKQRKIHAQGVRAGQPKRRVGLDFGSSFYMLFSPPLSLSYVNWTSQEGYLFHPRFSLQSLDLPLFHFCGLLPSLSFSHCHFGLLFFYSNYLTFSHQEMKGPILWEQGRLGLPGYFLAELGQREALGLPLLLVSSLRVLIVVSI